MIRSLETGLGIPAKVLLKEPDESKSDDISWNKFPIKEMDRRGYFSHKLTKGTDLNNLIGSFLEPVGSLSYVTGMLRKSNYRVLRPVNKHALIAWSTFLIMEAKKINNIASYKNGSIDLSFMQNLAKLSVNENGPLLAVEALKRHGIALLIEPHFAQTYLDGATIIIDKKHPIIGLTVRYDRLDNFWFTLMHELAHLSLHFDQNIDFFYDDLDNKAIDDEREKEADRIAGEALVPENKWESSPARLIPSLIAAESLAKELGIHIAIVAGKMRFENKGYHYLNNVINQAKVRRFFIAQK
jgi:HTH-type transcriptional regulator/antitoxin HigA